MRRLDRLAEMIGVSFDEDAAALVPRTRAGTLAFGKSAAKAKAERLETVTLQRALAESAGVPRQRES